MAHLGGAAPSAAQTGGNKLWEDNWDDDDIEDDFSVQLRCALSCLTCSEMLLRLLVHHRNELAKTGKGGSGGDAMQTS
jgi:hypothetical protein